MLLRKKKYKISFHRHFNRFSEKKLPTEDDFYSILNDEHISDTQNVHAIKVWNTFKLKGMGEYHDYLKLDVLLLEKLVYNIINRSLFHLEVLDNLGMQC